VRCGVGHRVSVRTVSVIMRLRPPFGDVLDGVEDVGSNLLAVFFRYQGHEEGEYRTQIGTESHVNWQENTPTSELTASLP
jgi:hypothetical protein